MKTKKKKIRSSLSSFPDFISEHSSVIKESFIALLICALGDLFAGIILGNMTFFLETFPGLLVIIPGAIGMRGNIFGSFASRLSTNLHIGMISPKFEFSEQLNDNIISSFVLTLLLSMFLAIIAKLFCILFHYESISTVDLILISVIAGVISNLIMLPITMLISFRSFNHGWDPDNVTTPIIAAVGDLFTLPAIIASVYILTYLNSYLLIKDIISIIIVILIIIALIYTIKRGEESKKIIYQSTPVLLLCSFLGVSAGGILNSSVETLLTNPSLLTLLPLFSGVSGSLISILSARLSSGLHYGLIEPLKKPTGESIHNFLICYILAVVMYPLIGFIAEDSTDILGLTGVGFVNIISISTISGFILLSLMIFVVYFISITSYNRDLDPDNIVIPISTSVTDTISSLTLIVISLLILGALF
ncbi:MAG: magnesium transporter [Methanobrevibacter sp.]|uniref:Divalent cation transporter n=1 Tax=Methanobrevibacter millerae TaxID=230361 RepID=A0A8T3VMF6_9EURY|nr:magnesium transporter [Methanobrevibacter millerae]MBE6505394.1 divalent cation transporter [Methanobrevibacter millerae]MBR0058139.1 magnesium transporter [Methanobrevibacter sp.]